MNEIHPNLLWLKHSQTEKVIITQNTKNQRSSSFNLQLLKTERKFLL